MHNMNIKIISITFFFHFISDYMHVNITAAMAGCIIVSPCTSVLVSLSSLNVDSVTSLFRT